jgi:hypothetical protein
MEEIAKRTENQLTILEIANTCFTVLNNLRAQEHILLIAQLNNIFILDAHKV